MEMQKPASDVPSPMDEARLQETQAFLDVEGDRIEMLECLNTYAYFFPGWLQKITEGIQNIIDYKQGKNIPCDEEKEILADTGYFFTKMAYFSGLIPQWHREMAMGKDAAEEALSRLSS
jgi:hypothetical protein